MTRIYSGLKRRWIAFWFEPASPTNLACCRIALYGPLAVFYGLHDYSVWAQVSPALYQPIWLFKTFHLPVLSPILLDTLQAAWKVALFAAAIGLFTSASCAVTALLGVYLIGLPHNFGQIYHFDAAIIFAFVTMALSRCGDALSVDAWNRAAPVARSGEYTWPIRLIWVTLSLVFFAAGVAKFWASGLAWITSDHMSQMLQRMQYHIPDSDPVTNWGSYISLYPMLARALAATTVVVETAYPLALLRTPLRPVLVIAGIGLIVGIRLLMGPTFEHFLLLNAFWVPWDRLGAWLRSRVRTRGSAPVRNPIRV